MLHSGPVSFSAPVAVAALTDGFHGGGSGFAYVSAGLNAAVPLTFLPGDWELYGGATFYYTDDSQIPGNPDDAFINGNFGVALSF